jgi:hypothetical protein
MKMEADRRFAAAVARMSGGQRSSEATKAKKASEARVASALDRFEASQSKEHGATRRRPASAWQKMMGHLLRQKRAKEAEKKEREAQAGSKPLSAPREKGKVEQMLHENRLRSG